ncbi:MAG TPA: hypothetical protein VMB75_03515, partial [Rhodocyclaceae bacterium]|nr:hypothetical protein [Rhodocyclaceae bacterium]
GAAPAARPRPAQERPDLRSLYARLTALVQARQPSAHISFGFMPYEPPRPEQLKLCLWADTDAQCAALARDPSLRQELDGPLAAALAAVCADHGFDWLGYVFFSTDAVKRDHKGKYDAWVKLPAVGGT